MSEAAERRGEQGDSCSLYWFLMGRSVFTDPGDDVVSKKQLVMILKYKCSSGESVPALPIHSGATSRERTKSSGFKKKHTKHAKLRAAHSQRELFMTAG